MSDPVETLQHRVRRHAMAALKIVTRATALRILARTVLDVILRTMFDLPPMKLNPPVAMCAANVV